MLVKSVIKRAWTWPKCLGTPVKDIGFDFLGEALVFLWLDVVRPVCGPLCPGGYGVVFVYTRYTV